MKAKYFGYGGRIEITAETPEEIKFVKYVKECSYPDLIPKTVLSQEEDQLIFYFTLDGEIINLSDSNQKVIE